MTEDTPAEAAADRAAARSTADGRQVNPDVPAAVVGGPSGGPAEPGQPNGVRPAGWRLGRRDRAARPRRKASFWRELPILLVVALVLAVLIKTFLVQAFFIPSSSMERTLHGCPGCQGD